MNPNKLCEYRFLVQVNRSYEKSGQYRTTKFINWKIVVCDFIGRIENSHGIFLLV